MSSSAEKTHTLALETLVGSTSSTIEPPGAVRDQEEIDNTNHFTL